MKKLCTAKAIWDDNRQYWKCNAQAEGQRKSFYSKTPGKRGQREAEAKAQEWVSFRRTEDPRLSEAVAAFEAEKCKTCAAYTVGIYKAISRTWLLVPWLEGKRLSRISLQDWQRVIDDATAAGRAKRTIRNIRSYIVSLTEYARRCRWVSEAVDADSLRISQQAPEKEKQILQPEPLKRLFDPQVDDWYINAYRLAAVAGLRRGEMVGLTWEHITDTSIEVTCSVNRDGVTTGGKTKNARRVIPMTEHARAILQDQRERLRRNGIVTRWVFPNDLGKRTVPDRMSSAWQRFRKEAGLPEDVTLHGLRHTMISLYKADVPEQLLKRVVGHSVKMDTFGVYGHEVADERARTAAMMDGRLERVLGE